jgi:hypothetical protein
MCELGATITNEGGTIAGKEGVDAARAVLTGQFDWTLACVYIAHRV